MALEITSRHIRVVKATKEHVRGKVERILEEFPWVENIHVILDGQRHNQIAEVVVQGKRHVRLEATAVADELFKAVDLAVEKMEKQLLKVSKKMQERRP